MNIKRHILVIIACRATSAAPVERNGQHPAHHELPKAERINLEHRALIKARGWRALDDAIRTGGLACVAYLDRMAVEPWIATAALTASR